MRKNPERILALVQDFTGSDLTKTLSRLEKEVRGIGAAECEGFLESAGAGREVLAAAAEMKRFAGQINVTIHALGILLCLPHLLEAGERVEYVSLGAGNTGRRFDLETNLRIAEFKFIKWRGGAEAIRQNSVFKDYLELSQYSTHKKKYLYLMGTDHAIKFLRGSRSLSSVLSRNVKLQKIFNDQFGGAFRTVGDYYAVYGGAVLIQDVSPWLSELAEALIAEPATDPDYLEGKQSD